MSFDLTIFNAINGLAGKWPVLDLVGIFLADYLPYVLVLILALFLLRKKQDKIIVYLAFISALVATFLVKPTILLFYARSRPYVVLTQSHKLINMPAFDNLRSFPSSHALFFFALAMAVYFYHKKWGIFFFGSAIVMGLARIFVGVHWLSDILAGAILGIAVAYFLYFLKNRLNYRVRTEAGKNHKY